MRQVVIGCYGEQNSNLSRVFKLELITAFHL